MSVRKRLIPLTTILHTNLKPFEFTEPDLGPLRFPSHFHAESSHRIPAFAHGNPDTSLYCPSSPSHPARQEQEKQLSGLRERPASIYTATARAGPRQPWRHTPAPERGDAGCHRGGRAGRPAPFVTPRTALICPDGTRSSEQRLVRGSNSEKNNENRRPPTHTTYINERKHSLSEAVLDN